MRHCHLGNKKIFKKTKNTQSNLQPTLIEMWDKL